MRARQKQSTTIEKEIICLPEGKFKTPRDWRRETAFEELYDITVAILQFTPITPKSVNNSVFLNALTLLKDADHFSTEINIRTSSQFESCESMINNPGTQVNWKHMWEYLRSTAMCAFALDDPVVLMLLHKHLKQQLFQDLIAETLVVALCFDSKKCFSILYDISKGRSIWSANPEKKIDLYIPLKPLPAPVAEIAKNGFSLSNQTFFKYLKFLERQPENDDKIRAIFTNLGIFTLGGKVCPNPKCAKLYDLVIEDSFSKLNHTIQILLLKLAADNEITCLRKDGIEYSEDFDKILALSDKLSKVNNLTCIRYQDIKRLINCIGTVLMESPELKGGYDKIGVIYTLRFMHAATAVIKTTGSQLSHIKNLSMVLCFAANAFAKSGIECNSYIDSCITPRKQINFLDRVCEVLLEDEKGFIEAMHLCRMLPIPSPQISFI